MRYVTRERIHVDRIASAWAIRRFVDRDATFEFIPRTGDVSAMEAIPFDLRGAELSHHDGRCTFDAVLAKYGLQDAGLHRMATIIRRADLPYSEPAVAEAPGVLAVLTGVRDGSDTDEQRLQRGSVVCDALYTYCQMTAGAGGVFEAEGLTTAARNAPGPARPPALPARALKPQRHQLEEAVAGLMAGAVIDSLNWSRSPAASCLAAAA